MALLLLAALASGPLLWAEASGRAPFYSAANIVNSVTFDSSALAPNGLASIFGTDLSYSTRALSPADIQADTLPSELAGVRVFVAGIRAHLYYVSEKQINFLIPSLLRPGEMDLWMVRDGTAGPVVRVTLLDSAPALFHPDSDMVLATFTDNTRVTPDNPAQPGASIVLYATGLGRTEPDVIDGQFPPLAFPLKRLTDLRVLLDGEAVEPNRIQYAGVSPGSAGLYQVNLKLPDQVGPDPEIRISLGDQISPAGLRLPAH